MLFSYSLLKKLVPAIKSKEDLAEKLTMRLFEVENSDGDSFNISILPNRYSDAASHWGLAREISAFYGKVFKIPKIKKVKSGNTRKPLVTVREPALCRRMMARVFENVKIAPSPKWMQKILVSCGMRPINNVVDITNYVTLETGQPLHAFDYDKMEDVPRDAKGILRDGKLEVRRAKKGEMVETLDRKKVKLDGQDLVLADARYALDIAGIKGGKRAEITAKTKRILLTAGNFDGVRIYKTSKKIGVFTDASARFSHHISPELTERGLLRASELIAELCGSPNASEIADVYPKKQPRRTLKLHIGTVTALLGAPITERQAVRYLKLLGFRMRTGFIEPPPERTDIATAEDIAEEIGRMYGYDSVPTIPPLVPLTRTEGEFSDIRNFKTKIRTILTGYGFDEVYNTSFIGDVELRESFQYKSSSIPQDSGFVEVENPISEDKKYLRHSLIPLLLRNVRDNLKFFKEVRVFELGNVFSGAGEKLMLGIALASKKNETLFDLKGAVEGLLRGLVVNDFAWRERDRELYMEAGSRPVGVIRRLPNYTSIIELDVAALLETVREDIGFQPIVKFPAVERDISILVPISAKIGDIILAIEKMNVHLIADVDLIDEYVDPAWRDRQSIALRVIFQAEDRTLTRKEIDAEMENITGMLQEKFGAEVR